MTNTPRLAGGWGSRLIARGFGRSAATNRDGEAEARGELLPFLSTSDHLQGSTEPCSNTSAIRIYTGFCPIYAEQLQWRTVWRG